MSKIKVLFFAADPLSAGPGGRASLQLAEELRQMRNAVQEARYRDDVEIDVRGAARTDDLLRGMYETPQVVHFSGHGEHNGLVFVGADGKSPQFIDAQGLTKLFRAFRGDIRVVVLNACWSLPQAEAIAEVVGCAIGTKSEIGDEVAITFAASFYRAIAFGESVQAAFDQASAKLFLDQIDEEQHPKLVKRPGLDPAQLFLIGPQEEEREARERGARERAEKERERERIERERVEADRAEKERERERIERERIEAERAEKERTRSLLAPYPQSGWIFPAVVWMLAGAGALALVENVVEALLLSLASLIVTIELLSFARSERFEALTRARAGVLALLLSAGLLVVGADLLNGELVTAKRLYRAGKYQAAHPIFEELAERRNPEAMGFLGIMYLSGQGAADQDSAGIRWLNTAAKERDPRAMYALGIAFEVGELVKRDYNEAMRLYRAAADNGHAEAMNKVGELNRRGLIAGATDPEALRWYRMAANAGSVDGMANYGLMHELGLGVQRDTDEAFRWYRRAARKGSLRAMVDLGWIYENGIGRWKDYSGARSWYQKAANAGHADAMNNLGVLYITGRGVPIDSAQATRWFQRAANAGSTVAAENLAKLGHVGGAGPDGPVALAVSRSGR